jgi:hypothetical protein
VDGQVDATRSGLNWVGNYNVYGINAVFVGNYGNRVAPVAEERHLDNFIVSRARNSVAGRSSRGRFPQVLSLTRSRRVSDASTALLAAPLAVAPLLMRFHEPEPLVGAA